MKDAHGLTRAELVDKDSQAFDLAVRYPLPAKKQ
jgi:hypothetical protein